MNITVYRNVFISVHVNLNILPENYLITIISTRIILYNEPTGEIITSGAQCRSNLVKIVS